MDHRKDLWVCLLLEGGLFLSITFYMNKWTVIFFLVILVSGSSFSVNRYKRFSTREAVGYNDSLRKLYSGPSAGWPTPDIDPGVQWRELGILPESPLKPQLDSLKHLITLGKTLFFDKRLSGSNQISCASCHAPQLSWADGRSKSVGHEQQLNKRNSPSLLNVWYYSTLFWDGRSKSLEDQAFSPINSETEMHSDMAELMMKLRRIEGYKPLFDSAFGRREISPETVSVALATFQRTLVGRRSAFDDFLSGSTNALSDAALRGLHLFRTKARCMNCHNGPLFTDNAFHNTGLSYYGTAQEDLGRYTVTHKAEDAGRFKTPSLRDVMRTRPWMHNGLFNDIDSVLSRYIAGAPSPKPGSAQSADTPLPQTDRLLQPLMLGRQDKQDLIAFLHAITAAPPPIKIPGTPK